MSETEPPSDPNASDDMRTRIRSLKAEAEDHEKRLRSIESWPAESAKRDLRMLGTVVLGALGMMGTVLAAALYIGSRLERLDDVHRRVGRLEHVVYAVDTED